MNKNRKTLKMPVRYLMNAVLVVLLFLALSYMTGNMLSTYQNKVLMTVGINVNSTISFTFAVGSALAGIGAVLYCCSYPQATPTMGSMLGLKAFVAAVLGGIGSETARMALPSLVFWTRNVRTSMDSTVTTSVMMEVRPSGTLPIIKVLAA